MKKSTVLLILIPSFFLFTATQCDDDNIDFSCDNNLESLSELSILIENLANSSECGDDFECRYIAYGAKPCGGPWRYLTYSTSIDTLQLQDLVEEYNSIEENYNMNCDAVSDCAVAIPPSGFECDNNQCIPIN
jgi:hypothetical protein